jgi:hypothetical protein
MSLCVFLLQILMLALVLVDRVNLSDADNPLKLPVNVETTVRIAQVLGIIIALFSQDDLLIGIEGLFKGLPSSFRGNECFQEISIIQWNVAYMLRFAQGFLNLSATFILLMQADNVFDLLLNFLGLEFISNLDDLAFRLGGSGYFGSHVKTCTEAISQAQFHQDEKTYCTGRKGSFMKAHGHVIGAFSVLVFMLTLYAFVWIFREQQEAREDIYVDETLPFLDLFNGCYTASETGEKYDGRIVWYFEKLSVDRSCIQCTESNPCHFEGECHYEKGTCACAHGATGALCRDTPLGDGVCNPYFNTEEYDYDGGDCCTTEANPCYFKGECHDKSGTCACAHGATGVLCRDTPLGDGVCNPYFNTEEYIYDGGDCCGATCVGASCGVPGLESVYGIDIELVQFNTSVFGYQHCQDPDMATFTIERKENRTSDCSSDNELYLDALDVRCDDKLYVRIPRTTIGGDSVSDPCNRSYTETIHVPYGASCELVVSEKSRPRKVLALYYGYGNDTGSRPIRDESDWFNESIFWNVPASKCIVQTISDYSNSAFDESSTQQGMAVQTLVNDGLSDSMCNQDRELLLERYALTLLNHSCLGLESPNLGSHQCYGWGLPAVEIVCENDKVISLNLNPGIFCEACQGTIPTELSLLSHLGKYNLALYISTLEWRISLTNVVNLISLKMQKL